MSAEHARKSNAETQAQPALPTLGQTLSVLSLSTALIFLWALFIREKIIEFPIELGELLEFDWFAPYLLGFALQETILPVALLYLFSRTQLFSRLLAKKLRPADVWKGTLTFIGLQALVFLYRFALLSRTEDQVTTGILIVLAAGIFGGWRAGLSVGAFTSLAVALLNSVVWIEPPDTFTLFGVLENIFFDMDALTSLWAGLVMGLLAERAPRVRLRPLFMLLSAGVLVLLSFVLILLSTDDPGEMVERVLPSIAIVLLAMLALAYMVRAVENEAVRREAEATQLQLAQTQLALSRAELRALHAQINPHFFFNTLNTIRYFVRTDADTARDLLVKLSEIFQRALQASEFVKLSEELDFVRTYLELEQARLDERLTIDWPEPEESLLEVQVPTLVLQPIVENAVLHGLAPLEQGGTLRIQVNRSHADLLIRVEDDGQGFDTATYLAGDKEGTSDSIGLSNVDERLQLLYGESYRLIIQSNPGKGTQVQVRIPLSVDP